MFSFIEQFFLAIWHILLESSFYILLGITVSALLKAVMSPESVAKHLGKGKFLPVFKAAFFGIPLPL